MVCRRKCSSDGRNEAAGALVNECTGRSLDYVGLVSMKDFRKFMEVHEGRRGLVWYGLIDEVLVRGVMQERCPFHRLVSWE